MKAAAPSPPTAEAEPAAAAAAAAQTAGSAPASAAPTDEIVYTLKGPQPQKFGVADGELANVLTASGSFVTRAVSGALCEGWTPTVVEGSPPAGAYTLGEFGGRWLKETSDVAKFPRPAAPIKLYEFEGCPFCRKVAGGGGVARPGRRVLPVPPGRAHLREFVKNVGGKSQFPYMVDDNTGVSMYESDDIIDYLYDKYGPGKEKVPTLLRAGALTVLTAGFRSRAEDGRGEQVPRGEDAREAHHRLLVRGVSRSASSCGRSSWSWSCLT